MCLYANIAHSIGVTFPKKQWGMFRAFLRTAGCEVVSPFQKPLLLHREISFIAHD